MADPRHPEVTWNDVLALQGSCDEFLAHRTDRDGTRSTFWHPSPRAQRILDRLRR